MLWKCCTQYASRFGKLCSCHRTGKGQFSFQSQREAMPKNVQTKNVQIYCTTALISHASKVMLKILQARLQQCVNCELPDVQAGFRKGRGTRDQIVNNCWITEKQESSRKASISVSVTMRKPLTVDQNKLWKIFRDGNTRPPYLSPDKPVCRSRSNS